MRHSKEDWPFVSIILQCGGVEYLLRLKECLRSLSLQNYPGKVERVLTYACKMEEEVPNEEFVGLGVTTLKVHQHVFDGWPAAWARNVGFRQSKGDILVTVDSDLLLRPDMLTEIVTHASKGAVVSIQAKFPDENFKNYDVTDHTVWARAHDHPGIIQTCRGALCIAASREAVFAVRGMDETFVGYGCEDVDFYKRLRRYGLREVNILEDEPSAKFIHQWHPRDRNNDNQTKLRNRALLVRNNEEKRVYTDNSDWGLAPDGLTAVGGISKSDYGGIITAPNLRKKSDPMRPRIFQIGFNRCGTKSLATFFKRHGFPTLDWHGGFLAALMEVAFYEGKPLLNYLDRYEVFTDMECTLSDYYNCVRRADERIAQMLRKLSQSFPAYQMKKFKILDAQYPGSKFILNHRPVDNWVNSRLDYIDGGYRSCSHGDNIHTNREALIRCWVKEWKIHHELVEQYFSDKSDRLLWFDIEKDDPQKLCDFFPEYDLNPEHWTHQNSCRQVGRV